MNRRLGNPGYSPIRFTSAKRVAALRVVTLSLPQIPWTWADPTGTGQRQQTDIGSPEKRVRFANTPFAADQRGWGTGNPCHPGIVALGCTSWSDRSSGVVVTRGGSYAIVSCPNSMLNGGENVRFSVSPCVPSSYRQTPRGSAFRSSTRCILRESRRSGDRLAATGARFEPTRLGGACSAVAKGCSRLPRPGPRMVLMYGHC